MNDNSELLETAWTQMAGKEVIPVALPPARGNGLLEERGTDSRRLWWGLPLADHVTHTVSVNPLSLTLAGRTTAIPPLSLFVFLRAQSEQESSEATTHCV